MSFSGVVGVEEKKEPTTEEVKPKRKRATSLRQQQKASEAELLKKASDENFVFRRLEAADFEKGFLEVLKFLTKVGETDK